ncbi:MAG TPA: C4-type zinc ribbon domain-containing protein [Acidobacteriota bacterium]|nr:C4-type zinc ribbon domain-containing protein [Acidobacteriota bacterium]
MEAKIENEELHSLILLQDLDLRMKQLRDKLRRVPLELKALEQELAEARQAFESVEKKQEEGDKERRRLEGEVEMVRQRLSKYKDQLMSVKTNREYQAMLAEIANCEKEISAKEDQILEKMILADEWMARRREAASALNAKEQEIRVQCQELETFQAQAETTLRELEAQRIALSQSLPPELTALYDRIATVRHGVAVAPALDQLCQACHVRLRPQLFNEVKTNQQIIRCESCSRILYYPSQQ